MLRGLRRLTWLEIKIFVREPLGLIGTVGIPVLLFVVLARLLGPRARAVPSDVPRFAGVDLPIFTAVLIATSAVLSLASILAIYREGGILKRLRATPLQPSTILTAHVVVKLLLTLVTFGLTMLAGRRIDPPDGVPLLSFAAALLVSTTTIVSMGFVIASVVPTARFAQSIGTLAVYPMLGLSGLFFPITSLPPALQAVSRVLPFTYAVSLMRGVWHGEGWSAHAVDVAVLAAMFVAFVAVSSKVFRWE